MVHRFLPVPFADAARQQLFMAMQTALSAEPDAPATVLLGNLGAFAPIAADALLVRPTGAVLVTLTPQSGRLTMPALAYGGWRLDGQPLPPHADADNPFEQYRQQRPAALVWLSDQTGGEFVQLPGVALFASPLTFGPEVENHLQHPAAADFQLVGGPAHLPARLRALEKQAVTGLSEAALFAWIEQLHDEQQAMGEHVTDSPTSYLTQKLRQLWSWLGAEDIPNDPPYGGEPPTPPDQPERARLEQLRHELQTELSQQRQEAAAREAARTQELAQLRQQLAQAGLSAAEQQATGALEEELRTARAALAARNQELDTRIQQLGQLLKQLHTTDKLAPARASTPPVRATPSAPQPVAQTAVAPVTKAATPSFRRLRQAERWGIVALVLAGVGAGAWGMVRVARHTPTRSRHAVAHRRNSASRTQSDASPGVVYVIDSTLTRLATPAPADTAGSFLPAAEVVPAENVAPVRDAAEQPAADSAAASPAAPTPPVAPDSATTPSPTP